MPQCVGKLSDLEGKGVVFLMAATLRPETMYGQTNCWALPEGTYGAYRGNNEEIYIMSERSALNLSFQVFFPLYTHETNSHTPFASRIVTHRATQ